MARNDFIEGFLHGLYNAGIGNPAVNEARAQGEQESKLKQAQLNAEMAGKGMIPDPQQPRQGGVATAFKNIFMPGSQGSQLNTAFVKDPNIPKAPSGYITPEGKSGMTTESIPEGSFPDPQATTHMAENYRAEETRKHSDAIKDPNNPIIKAKQINDDWKEVRKISNPFRSTGMGGASSVFNKAATANQAAARGLAILNKPTLTWKELNAYVNSDIASIQRGGGSPTDIQLHEANYNTLMGHVGNLATFVTGKPATGIVPSETVAQIRQNIMDIINVDNQIIDDGIGYVESSYPEAIAAHKGTWDSMKTSALKIKAVGGGGTASAPSVAPATPMAGQPSNQPAKVGPFSDPDKERRYQEWKKSNGS